MRVLLILATLLTAVSASAQMPVAAPPKVFIDTAYSLPSGGKTWNAHTAADFTRALDDSRPGDVIVLDAGATYSGNFSYPAKANPDKKWIYVASSSVLKRDSGFPSPGTRISPRDTTLLAKLISPTKSPALVVAAGASNVRFVGLEITTSSDLTALVQMQQGEVLADSVTIDRCYIHGQPDAQLRRGVTANATNVAIIDSYLSENHESGADSQAILAFYTPGPIKIVNNLLSATGEDVMFGGAGGLTNPYVPSDIEIRGNHFFKPIEWTAMSQPPGNKWVVKNNLEFKSGQRVLVEGNTFENVWTSGQMGFSVMLTVRTNQSGLNATVKDILFTKNTFKNVSSGFNIGAFDNNCKPERGCTNPGETRRIVFRNNLFELGDTRQVGYSKGYVTAGLIGGGGVTDFVFDGNTVTSPPNQPCKYALFFNTKPPYDPPRSNTHNVWIINNKLCGPINGNRGPAEKGSALMDYMGDPEPVKARFFGNTYNER